MFLHIFINRIKCITRDRQTMFWTAVFPLLLATLFGLAFSNLSADETFKQVPVAVADNSAYRENAALQTALEGVSGSGEDKLFTLTTCEEEKAAELLQSGEIKGYIIPLPENGLRVMVKESGISQTILKSFADHYLQVSSAYGNILAQNPAALQALTEAPYEEVNYLKETPAGASAPDNTVVYYFALIAMACLYGAFQGMNEVTAVQANQSYAGARVNLAPVHKLKVFGYSLLAATLIQILSILLLIGYLRFVLGVQFGDKFGFVILAAVAGSCVGVAYGAVVGALLKKSEGLKTAAIIGLSMIFSFLAGLMYRDMKYIVSKNAPLLSYLNPANLIADAYYSLYYYDTLDRYLLNIGLLFAFSAVLFLIVYFVMRRQKYASL